MKVEKEREDIIKRIQAGLLFLSGKDYDEIAEAFSVARGTVYRWLKFCRTIHPWKEIENYRYNIRKLLAKRKNLLMPHTGHEEDVAAAPLNNS